MIGCFAVTGDISVIRYIHLIISWYICCLIVIVFLVIFFVVVFIVVFIVVFFIFFQNSTYALLNIRPSLLVGAAYKTQPVHRRKYFNQKELKMGYVYVLVHLVKSTHTFWSSFWPKVATTPEATTLPSPWNGLARHIFFGLNLAAGYTREMRGCSQS